MGQKEKRYKGSPDGTEREMIKGVTRWDRKRNDTRGHQMGQKEK